MFYFRERSLNAAIDKAGVQIGSRSSEAALVSDPILRSYQEEQRQLGSGHLGSDNARGGAVLQG